MTELLLPILVNVLVFSVLSLAFTKSINIRFVSVICIILFFVFGILNFITNLTSVFAFAMLKIAIVYVGILILYLIRKNASK